MFIEIGFHLRNPVVAPTPRCAFCLQLSSPDAFPLFVLRGRQHLYETPSFTREKHSGSRSLLINKRSKSVHGKTSQHGSNQQDIYKGLDPDCNAVHLRINENEIGTEE
ncbi:uncharacterized protein LOC118539103 [Halichoerus grypus]